MECYCGESHAGSFDSALDALAGVPDLLAAAIENLDKDQRRQPGRRRSIAEIVARLKHSELAASVHYRQMIVETTPDLFSFDPDRWAKRLVHDGNEAPVPAVLELFRLLRADNIRLLRSLEPSYRQHEGWYPEYGSTTLEALVIHMAADDAKHLRQIEEYRSSSSS